MNKIVENKVLEAIHYKLESNEFKFTDEEKSLADTYITPFIDDLDITPKEFNVVTVGVPKLVTDKRIIPIFIRYFAFIENNMDLYTALKKEDYVFYENYTIKFYSLDKVLTGNFSVDEYKKLLLEYEGVVSKFYSSIRGLEKSEKEKYCREFRDIVLKDTTVLDVGYSNGEEDSNYNFLIKRNIELLGKDFLLRLDKKQREMINSICINLTEEEANKIKDLYNKYPTYSGRISISSPLLKYFSVDEISSMSTKDSVLYEEALNVGLLSRMKSILELNPDFNCPIDFIKKEIFDSFTDEEIVGLSEKGKEEILNINISDIDGSSEKAMKFLKKVLTHDLRRKNNEESMGSIKK